MTSTLLTPDSPISLADAALVIADQHSTIISPHRSCPPG